MICEKPTRANPQGRTGTTAGFNAHQYIKEDACEPCKSARSEYLKSYAAENRRDQTLRLWYGISTAEYEAMLEAQGGGCAICGTTEPGGKGCFAVDHDHSCCPTKRACGKCNRGLLCSSCNMGIGQFKDNPERLRKAAEYIEGSKQ